jgi:hypothetical protein
VLAGYVLGCAAGFVVAILADRFLFLRRGLMPIGNMVSALPIIGVAPIMVMWFGFDWQSKAAVVVIMTFFPMLVNTVAGLAAAGHMERDLMRTYASSYWQTLVKLRLPAAAPVHLQRAQDQLDAGADRRHRGRILRHAGRRHGLPHLDRDRAHERRHGLGGNRSCGARRFGLLWRDRPSGKGRHVLASVYPRGWKPGRPFGRHGKLQRVKERR